MWRAIVFPAIAVLASCASVHREFIVLSWPSGQGHYRFAVVPDHQYGRFIQSFTPRMAGIDGVDGLRAKLRTLPAGSGVSWTDAECFDIKYPPQPYIDRVTSLVKSDGIDLALNPSVCE